MDIKQKNKRPDYSVIIPAHNEAEFITRVLTAACGSKAKEIVVVDDGSTDATEEIIRKFSEKYGRVRLVQHARNRGYCAARKTGMRHARTDNLVFFDGDIKTARSAMFDRLARPLIRGHADYVIGSFDNFGRVTEYLAKPLIRHFLPPLARIKQPLSGLVGIRREFTFPNKMGRRYANLGVLLDAYFAGARFTEVPLGQIEHDHRPDVAKRDHANEACRMFFQKLSENGLIYAPNISGKTKISEKSKKSFLAIVEEYAH